MEHEAAGAAADSDGGKGRRDVVGRSVQSADGLYLITRKLKSELDK